MLRTGLVEVVNEAGVARQRAVRRRAWFRRRPDSSRVSESDRWTVMLGEAVVFSEPPSSWKQSGRSVARLRLARKPKLRMRTKPGGSRWSRKRRRNSSTAES